jgi:ribosomal protein L22
VADDRDDERGEDAVEPEEQEGRAADAEEDVAADTEAAKPASPRRRRSAEVPATPARGASASGGSRSRRRGTRDGEAPIVVRAQAKYVRTAPRKARLVIDHIRGKQVAEARAILMHTPRAAAVDVLKLLDSAVANAENNHELVADELRIERAYVDEGPTLKRYRPRALGRATRIRKRTSHMTIALTPKE